MKNRTIKIILILFSIIFALRVITIFTADRLYSMSMAVETGKIPADRGILFLGVATKLDSTNAKLYFQKYEILRGLSPKGTVPDEEHKIQKQQLHLLKKCIDLCPSWAAYHIYYAFTLRALSPKPNIITRDMIASEFKKASDLKPYSPLYCKIYERYIEPFSR